MCYNSLASPCAECDCHSLRLSAIPILSLSNVSLQDKYFFMFINIFLGSTPSTGWCSGAAPRVPGPDPHHQPRPQELPQQPPRLREDVRGQLLLRPRPNYVKNSDGNIRYKSQRLLLHSEPQITKIFIFTNTKQNSMYLKH